ncbi:uncharacterized protein ATC70_007254 [Mucor velutinosus]|uniref:Uncharacterized protein n=1 Tax=Mucor velutinosus TaxID=708070 RepID=A0AAN7D686_9FUNG|nr:hypothetical protein ATC70_007254 [Mucor velutinosus]
MLLSTAALEKHKDNYDMFKHQMKLNRVKTYVADQQSYIHQYRSPNSSNIGSVPESCENQEPLSSNAFSASISEIIRRKQARPEASLSPNTQNAPLQPSCYTRKQPLLHPSSIDCYIQETNRPAVPNESVHQGTALARHSKKHKSSSSHASEKISLQTKPNIIKKAAHGMHLLQKFVSPNLKISRITMKSNNRQPKLGIFRKGKSSALGRPIPDITDFLDSTIQHKENIKPAVVMEDLSHEPPSISKFFSKRPAQTFNSASSHTHHATTVHQDKPKEAPQTTPVLSSDHLARKGFGSPAADAAAPYEAFSNNSFDSIYRLLDECQDRSHYLTATNDPHAKPNYAPVKTPHSVVQPTATADHAKINPSHLSFLSNSKLPHPLYPSLAHRSPTPHNEPLFAQPPHDNNTSSPYSVPPQQPQRPLPSAVLRDQKLSAPSWQVADSEASFAAYTAAEEYVQLQQQEKAADDDDHTTTANDDLELILQSQTMNMLDESIQQNDETIQSFWLRQPSFTTRGH